MAVYYTVGGVPVANSRGVSSSVRAEFTSIQTGFASVNTDITLRGLKAGETWTGTHDFSGATSLLAPTPTAGDSTTKVATTAFVTATAFSSSLPGQGGNSGKYLTTDGANASWGSLATGTVATGGTGITSYTIGDMVYASGATTLSKLADVATGNALISGGVGVAPSWGKIPLTSHISGILPVANGGTGVANDPASTFTISGAYSLTATLTAASAVTFPVSGILATRAGSETLTNKTIAGANNTITGLALTTAVTGVLPVTNGGTGLATLTANNVVLGNGTSNVQFVAPGTSGNVLTSNGTTWASSAPNASLTFVSATTAATAASVDFTGLVAGNDYILIFDTAYPSTTADLQILFSTNAGGAWLSSYSYTSVGSNAGAAPSTLTATAGATWVIGASLDGNATSPCHGTVHLRQGGLSNKLASAEVGFWNGSAMSSRSSQARINSAGTIDAMRVITSAGTITGTFRLYKLARS